MASRAHYRAKGIDFNAQKTSTPTKTGFPEYEVSKLANVLFTKSLAERLEGTGVTTYSLHPGVVASDIWRKVPGPLQWVIKQFMITNEEGAQTSLHCALSDEAADQTGLYYDKSKPVKPSRIARDDGLAAQLWAKSVEWTDAEWTI